VTLQQNPDRRQQWKKTSFLLPAFSIPITAITRDHGDHPI
jgi:hypothetical protein